MPDLTVPFQEIYDFCVSFLLSVWVLPAAVLFGAYLLYIAVMTYKELKK